MLYTKEKQYTIYNASCLDVMDLMEENSIDCIVTDPPYEIGFMGKGWDSTGIAFSIETWEKALRVLKPGGYLLAFNHSRTFHRMMVAIEDAGFELRDTIMWLYGSGFPKSHNISKAIDKSLGVESEVIGIDTRYNEPSGIVSIGRERELVDRKITTPTSTQAKQWDGYGTALKPAFEPIVMARKPFRTSVAENVLTYGVGGINIDECKIGSEERFNAPADTIYTMGENKIDNDYKGQTVQGRFPANIIHDGSEEACRGMYDYETYSDASRYFYTAKASVKDRDDGLSEFESDTTDDGRMKSIDNAYQRGETLRKNIHPTVKPTDLMQYLVRLVAPKGATVLDIFMGSGSTGKACMIENTERNANYHFIGIDLEKEYCDIAKARIEWGINFRELEDTHILYDDDGNEKKVIQDKFDLFGDDNVG